MDSAVEKVSLSINKTTSKELTTVTIYMERGAHVWALIDKGEGSENETSQGWVVL